MLLPISRVRPRSSLRIGCGGVLVCAAAAVCADITTGTDPEAGLPFWELRDVGISLRLVQRQPDQTRAFFLARGFSRDATEQVARRCVFQTVFKNTSAGAQAAAVTYDLRDWNVRTAENDMRMLTREFWAERWANMQVAKPARIAFEWALFPTRQTYNPGDYNWGMSVFDLPSGGRFDLTVVWRHGDHVQRARIDNIRCAPEADAADAERME